MKRIIIIFLLFFTGFNSQNVYGQVNPSKESVQNLLKATPQEQVFIHYNTSLLFAGEYLYYKVYNRNAENKELSDISKTAYVELVGADRQIVFRHKINLTEGVGKGDFFIPVDLPSGNYKLIGYTTWSVNSGSETIFQGDVAVLNPYRGDQSALLSEAQQDSLTSVPQRVRLAVSQPNAQRESTDSPVSLSVSEEILGTREAVILDLRSRKGDGGNYSVSVRKIDAVYTPVLLTSLNFSSGKMSDKGSGQVHLPELRGELITGRLESESSDAVAGQSLAVSVPGENFILKITRTDEEGRFYFHLDGALEGSQAILQILGEQEEAFTIIVDPKPTPRYTALEFADFEITPQMEEHILKRSIYNQVENGYFRVKPDTLRPAPMATPFYGERMENYDLDNYTRFETLKETFTEFIRWARITKNEAGEDIFHVTGYNTGMKFDLLPLVIVDGVMVQRHADIINWKALRIKNIGILRDKYFLGTEVFQGIIRIETVNRDFDLTRYTDDLKDITLIEPQPEKFYFHQTYDGSSDLNTDRIPDFRTQLLWKPDLKLDTARKQLEFYTSDIPGDYEISVEGFTESGEPVSLKKMITVQQPTLR